MRYMPKLPPIPEIASRIKEGADRTLRTVPRALTAALAKRDAEHAHNVVRSASLSCMEAAMVYARQDHDYAVARRYCNQCADYANVLIDMARQGLTGTPWSGFFILYCSLMAGRFEKAEAVAQWMLQCPVVAEDEADPADPLAMLSGLAMLDLRERFLTYRRERYDASWHASHPFFGPLSVYLDLWQTVLDRDQSEFDKVMQRREEHCIRLSKQKEEGRLGFGGGVDSNFIVDFMGIGCAIVARRRGMSCDVDTIYLPRVMVDMAFETADGG